MSVVRSIHSCYRLYACLALYSLSSHLQLDIICAGTLRTSLRHDRPEASPLFPSLPAPNLMATATPLAAASVLISLLAFSIPPPAPQVSIASPPSKICAGIRPSAKSFSSLAISARLLAAWIAARILLFSSSV